MTSIHTGRYSKYIRPISICIDLLVVSLLCLFFFKKLNLNCIYYFVYQTFAWLTIAFFIKFYGVYRFTTPVEILSKIVKQGILFLLVIIAFFPFSKQVIFSGKAVALFMVASFILITLFKFLLFFYLKKYRIVSGNNFRNIVIIGYTDEAIKLKQLFDTRIDYGYRFFGYFSNKKHNKNIIGKIEDLKDFVLDNKIDEIYCSLNEISSEQLADLVEFADENSKTIKFIPDTNEIFTKNLQIDYYEMFPVLSLQKTILHEPTTKIFKRAFDIFFSLIVIIFILSWLVPLLALIIKIESKGQIGRASCRERV